MLMNSKIRVSFCIPSLNRSTYLLSAIQSICSDLNLSKYFEVCIYNNCSDESYSGVESTLFQLKSNYNIQYIRGNERLPIDKSMHNAIKLAQGEYLFLLGDDDFLLPDGLSKILDLIEANEFDMAVFNAVILNEKNKTRLKMFNLEGTMFQDLRASLLVLKNYCSYGNILIRSELYNAEDFDYLDGTSHAYGCFWLNFFRKYELGIQPRVLVVNEPIVCLRAILKTYNLLEVTFKHSQKELNLYYAVIGEKSKVILKEYEVLFWKDQSRLKKLVLYGLAGNDLSKISTLNVDFFNQNRVKIHISRFLSFSLKPVKKVLKYMVNYYNR